MSGVIYDPILSKLRTGTENSSPTTVIVHGNVWETGEEPDFTDDFTDDFF